MCNEGLRVRKLMMNFTYSGQLRKYQIEFKRLFKQYLLDPIVEAKESDQAGTISGTTSLLQDGSGFLLHSTKQNFSFNRLHSRLHWLDGFKHSWAIRDTFDNGPFSGNKGKMNFIKGVLTFHLGANHSSLIPQDTY